MLYKYFLILFYTFYYILKRIVFEIDYKFEFVFELELKKRVYKIPKIKQRLIFEKIKTIKIIEKQKSNYKRIKINFFIIEIQKISKYNKLNYLITSFFLALCN